jgi:hypothetical protein
MLRGESIMAGTAGDLTPVAWRMQMRGKKAEPDTDVDDAGKE